MEKLIVVKPIGGLANRMRVIESAFFFAQMNDCKVRIVWEKSSLLNCSFYKLFELSEKAELIEYNRSKILVKIINGYQKFLRASGLKVPLGFDYYIVNDDAKNELKVKKIPCYKKVYIQTFHKLSTTISKKQILLPIKNLNDEIKNVTTQYNNYTLGVHIRRTDNIKSIKYSPSEEFYRLIDQELKNEPRLSIYLATDSLMEEKEMVDRYPGKIICRKKSLDRNSEMGIRDALIDLYCLANTNKIIGSFYSSFSEVAAEIGGIELVQVYNQTND